MNDKIKNLLNEFARRGGMTTPVVIKTWKLNDRLTLFLTKSESESPEHFIEVLHPYIYNSKTGSLLEPASWGEDDFSGINPTNFRDIGGNWFDITDQAQPIIRWNDEDGEDIGYRYLYHRLGEIDGQPYSH